MDNAAKAILFLTLLAASSPLVNSDCNLHENVVNSPCGGLLSCARDFSDAISEIEQMPCLYLYNDYSEEHVLHQNFTITIEADDFDFTANDSSTIDQLKDHIYAISIRNGRIKKFPDAILNLRQATIVDLSGNNIDYLNLAALARPSALNVLNMSYNNIEHLELQIGWPSSWQLPVTTIDFSHNNIQGVLQSSIAPYVSLQHLNLSYNYIESFNENTFCNLTGLLTLDISNNRIVKLDSSLAGMSTLQDLSLDHNHLESLNQDNFRGLSALKYLNISFNNLKSIDSSSFRSLYSLMQLDLSNNYMNVILKSTFQNNSLLRSLDVSFNQISRIESGAFSGAHIEDLKLHNNTLLGYLDTDAFNGLYFEKLDLSDGDIGALGPDLFGPHPTFQSLNFSKNVISDIDMNTFRNLNYLVNLDLSYNKLKAIDFDTLDMKNLTYFYVNNNLIKQIRKEMFEPLTTLQIIDLSNNAIKAIQSLTFKNLKLLQILYLKNNPIVDIYQQAFAGLTSCYILDLSGSKIKTLSNNSFYGMGFLNNLNLSNSDIKLLEFNVFYGAGAIKFLDLSHNHIESFSLNNTNTRVLQNLLLTSNKLTSINKTSFKNLSSVTLLDISYNRISYIQPGSFNDCGYIFTLNLNSNDLSFIQFGVFEGLERVRTIDISNNRLHSFNAKLLYNLENLQNLYLDNNFIDKVNLSEFTLTKISTLSLGGNLLTCDVLMDFMHPISGVSVIAKSPNFAEENVDGVVCTSESEIDNNQVHSNKIGNNNMEKLINTTNRYLAANFGAILCAMLGVLCIFGYLHFRNKFNRRVVSSSRELLTNEIELETS